MTINACRTLTAGLAAGLLLAACNGLSAIDDAARSDERDVRSPEELRAEVEALQDPDVAWRQIQWRTCLMEGMAESRQTGKPMILWIFIDRPVDDERC